MSKFGGELNWRVCQLESEPLFYAIPPFKIHMKIEELGFNNWFKNQINKSTEEYCEVARVVAVEKEKYSINNGTNEVMAEITGKLMYTADSPMDFPTVGDWVYAQYFDEGSFAIIHEVFPRRTILKRKASGKRIEHQLIAANIDTALIVQALDQDFNLNRLERYLVMTSESQIQPVILLSKSDLISGTELEEKKSEISRLSPQTQILAYSNVSNSGLDKVEELLTECKTFCLLGSSGVGENNSGQPFFR